MFRVEEIGICIEQSILGWGSRIFYFDMESMPSPAWTSNVSNPYIYESPRMFNHEGELYLVARTDPTGPFMSSNNGVLPPTLHHLYDLAAYSLRPHGTAMWKLNRDTAELEWLLDLPGCGDTAFPRSVCLERLVRAYVTPSQYIFFIYFNFSI